MKQRVMKLFLAFMVMTGLFGMGMPVKAETPLPDNTGTKAVLVTGETSSVQFTIWHDQDQDSAFVSTLVTSKAGSVTLTEGELQSEISLSNCEVVNDTSAGTITVTFDLPNGFTGSKTNVSVSLSGFSGTLNAAVSSSDESQTGDNPSEDTSASEDQDGNDQTTPVTGYSISVQEDGTVVIGLPDDFEESENKYYQLDFRVPNGPAPCFGINMEISVVDGHKYIYLPGRQIPPTDQIKNADVSFWKLDSNWDRVGEEIYLGHLDSFGPYNISDIAGHAEIETIEETDYLKLWFDDGVDAGFVASEWDGKIRVSLNIDSENSGWGNYFEIEGESRKQVLIPLDSITDGGFKSTGGSYQVSVTLQNTRYEMGSAVFPVSGEDGTVSVTTDESGKQVSFSLTELTDYEVTLSDNFELILMDADGKQYYVSPNDTEISFNDGIFSFSMDESYVGHGPDQEYLPEGQYTVSLNVYRNNDGPLFFKADGETHYFAEKGIKQNDDAACTINITDTVNFAITCTGLTEREIDIFHTAGQSITFENQRRINHLISQPSWGVDGTSVTLTVNEENLIRSTSQYIPAGSVPSRFEIHDENIHFSYPLTVEEGSQMNTLGPIKVNIEDLVVAASEDKTYFTIDGDPDILADLYRYAYRSEYSDEETDDINWQTEIYLNSSDYQKNYNIPSHDDTFCMLEWNDPDTKDFLIVKPEILKAHNVEEGYYFVTIECSYANFGEARFGEPNGIYLKPLEQETITGVTAVEQVNDYYSILITVPEGKEDYLWALNAVGIYNSRGNGGYTSPFYSEESRRQSIERDGKDNTITIDPQKMYFCYSMEPDPNGMYIYLQAKGYKDLWIPFDYTSPLKSATSAPFYQIDGDGVVMMTADKAYADAVLEIGLDEVFHRPNMIELSPYSDGHDPIMVGNSELSPGSNTGIFKSIQTKRTGVNAVLIPISYGQLEDQGYGNPNLLYYLSQQVHLYREYDVHNYTYSLAPVYAKYLIDQAEAASGTSGTLSISDLEHVDQAALLVDKDKMNNCTVADSEKQESEVAGLGVSVSGEVGAAVKDDLSTIFDVEPVITVNTEISQYTAVLSADEIASETGIENPELTDVQFDINLSKTYAASGTSANEPVAELPYGAAVTFNLPEGDTLEEGQSYQLVSKHGDEVLTYDVTVENGKGVAYVDKYSSFVLVKGVKNDSGDSDKSAWIQWNGPENDLVIEILGTAYDPDTVAVRIDGTQSSDNTSKSVTIDFKNAPFSSLVLPVKKEPYEEGERVRVTIPWMIQGTGMLESLFSGDTGFDPNALAITVLENGEELDTLNYTHSGGGGDGDENACQLSFSNGTFTVTCAAETFSPDKENKLLLFRLDESGHPVAGPPIQLDLYPPTVNSTGSELSFTYDLLAELGQYIPDANYKVQIMIDGSRPQDVSQNQHFGQVNKPAPSDLSVAVRESDKSIVISTADKDFLDYIVANQTRGEIPYSQRYGKPAYGINTGIMLKNGNVPVFFPKVNGELPLSAPTQNGEKWEIVISADDQSANGLQNGDQCTVTVHAFGTNGPGGDDKGYENKELGSITIGTETQDVVVDATLINNLQAERIDIVVMSQSLAYLANLNGITLTNKTKTDIPSSGISINVDPSEIQSQTDGQGNLVYLYRISMEQLSSGLYGLDSGLIEFTLHSNGFNDYTFESDVEVTNPFKNMPPDIQITVIGEGFSIRRTSDVTDSDGALEGIYNSSLTAWVDKAKIPVTLLNADNNADKAKSLHMRKDDSHYVYSYDSTQHKLFIKTAYSTLAGDWNITDPNASYVMNLVDPEYGQLSMQNGQTLAPMIVYEAALNGITLSEAELKNLDSVALNEVVNISITASETDTSGMNVEISGEVAAAAASNEDGQADPGDLNYDEADNKTVTITTSVTVPTDPEMEAIEEFQNQNGLQSTDVRFSVGIVKNSTVTGSGYPVSVLPYEVSVEFALPAEPAPEGYHYVLLREHTETDGSVTVEPIEWQPGEDGKGAAFTDKFSTFAMAIEKDAPKPAPSDKDTVKPSSSDKKSDSKNTSPVHTDNVVTCQMAGYPSEYAWNEAAEACQPGFLDNAGVFHGTAVRKAGVPNTYDKGLKGSFFSLMASIIVGISAAYALRKY